MENYGTRPNWVRRKCIGKGSFGAVSLARGESDDGLTFAVKSVEVKAGEFLRCLENEIRILKSLSSPYVVRYLGDDVTLEFSSVYRNLHMEYMPGGTVAELAKHDNGANIRNYTWCITSALAYIHSQNVVHCDVKGANVLTGNTPGTAKLADFGSAIKSGVPFLGIRGSPQWMAPEVIRGEYIGPESDVWSLGCTVIEMITGKPPWQDKGADTFRQIGYSDDLPEFPTRVPDDLRDFVMKCLKREPSERWSCDQLLHHPYLLSCSSPPPMQITINEKLSPRCAFDWLDSSSSDESTVEIYQFNENRVNAKQRIGKLASTSRVNWESEGWEMVRHVPITASTEFAELAGSGERSPEYADSGDEGASVSGRGWVNWDDTESNASYSYELESTTSDARGTMVGGFCGSSVDRYRCRVWIEKLFRMLFLVNSTVIQHIQYTQWVTSTLSLFALEHVLIKRVYLIVTNGLNRL